MRYYVGLGVGHVYAHGTASGGASTPVMENPDDDSDQVDEPTINPSSISDPLPLHNAGSMLDGSEAADSSTDEDYEEEDEDEDDGSQDDEGGQDAQDHSEGSDNELWANEEMYG